MHRGSFRALAASGLVLMMATGTAHASLVYGFDDFTLAPTQTIAHTTASDFFTEGPFGVCSGPGVCGVYGSGTLGFTVTPEAGWALDVTRFSFEERNFRDHGPTAFAVYTSADGYAHAILSATLGPFASAYTLHEVALPLLAFSQPLQVRIVARGPSSGALSPWMLDNVTLDAVARPTVAVSAPPTWALSLLALVTLGALRRR